MCSAALSWRQTDDLFRYFMFANDTRMPTRPTTLGCSGYNNKCSTYTAYGMAYGLLVADMVERFETRKLVGACCSFPFAGGERRVAFCR